MKYNGWALATLLLAGCATFGQGDSAVQDRQELWALAHQALAVEDFERADALFRRLAGDYTGTEEGHEATFYLGALRLDPRNPAWNPGPAEEYLSQYLAADSMSSSEIAPSRPEARTLLELASQLNMPPQERVPALQAGTQVVVEAAPQRVVVPAAESRALAAEVSRLRRELAGRDSTIQTQRDEIERIRKTLIGRDGG